MTALRVIVCGAAVLLAGCDGENAPPPPISEGETAYRTACASCHQWDGRGLPGMYPPLSGVNWVQTDDPARLIRIVLHGMVGPVRVNGEMFQTTAPIMPGQGAMLPDERIAEVLTFVLQRFGGRESTVSPEDVAKVREIEKERKTPWTERELMEK